MSVLFGVTGQLVCLLAAATGSTAPEVCLVSPAPEVSGSAVRPFLETVLLREGAKVCQVVWVAAECETITEAQAAQLLAFAQAGSAVVIEDAPRLATGTLAQALGMTPARTRVSTMLQPVRCLQDQHPAVIGVPLASWRLPCPEYFPQVEGAKVVVAAEDGWPVVWVRGVGKGKVVGIAAQRSQWTSGAQAVGYDGMLVSLLAASARAHQSLLAELSARTAFRGWVYLGLPAGQALYLLRADVPPEYDGAREEALRAWRLASTKPVEALRLADSAARGVERLVDWAEAYWRKVPTQPLRKASGRQDLLLCPGTLDFLHCMNMSSGAPVAGTARPATGREMWSAQVADNPPGPATGHWRGLRPFLALTAELPTSINPAFQQVQRDGAALGRPCWLESSVRTLMVEAVPPIRGDTFVMYSRGQPWLTASCDPKGDYSPAAVKVFQEAAEHLQAASSEAAMTPPEVWEATPRWLAWQQARAESARLRWRDLATAVRKHSSGAIVGVDAGYLGDPLYAGLGPETGAEHLDCLAPVTLANYEKGFDPADLVAAICQLASIADRDMDGVPDQWPGCVARFRWGDVLGLTPAAHELLAVLALACGAQGIIQTVAETPDMGDATAVVPEEVYLRYEASFEPAVRGQALWQEARLECDAAVWQSFGSACMARPDNRAERTAALRALYWAATVARLGYVPRYVFDADVEAGRLSDVGVLVVPSILSVGAKACAVVEQFVRDGGTMVLGPGSLSFDEYHRPLMKKPNFLSGVSFSVRTAEDEVVKLDAKGTLTAGLILPGSDVSDSLRQNGQVVGWSWSVGKGRVVYLSSDRVEGSTLAWLAKMLDSGNAAVPSRTTPVVVCSAGARGMLLRLEGGRHLALVYNAGAVGEQTALAEVGVSLRLGPGAWEVEELQPSGPLRPGALKHVPVSTTTAAAGHLTLSTSLAPQQYRLFLLTTK